MPPPSAAGLQEEVAIAFSKGGEEIAAVRAPIGATLLELAQDNDVELEGACDGTLACSTCHLILEQAVYDRLEPPSEDELDMLDMAFELTETSRLGCQIKVSRELAGARFALPESDWLPSE